MQKENRADIGGFMTANTGPFTLIFDFSHDFGWYAFTGSKC